LLPFKEDRNALGTGKNTYRESTVALDTGEAGVERGFAPLVGDLMQAFAESGDGRFGHDLEQALAGDAVASMPEQTMRGEVRVGDRLAI
jgi:hypothetical protein